MPKKNVLKGVAIATTITAIVMFGLYAFSAYSYPKEEFALLKPVPNNNNQVQDPLGDLDRLNLVASDENKLLQNKDVIHILLLGIDRRSRNEGFRTDTMILASINLKDKRAVLTSIPRDLWYKSGRLNAEFPANGWEGIQVAIETITGQKPDRYIMTDFADFKWIVDQMGGVPVQVERSFTDKFYPVDETFEYQVVSFQTGLEIMDGERALIFARSRKGDFDNGDWGRMKRQHLLVKGMLDSLTQEKSFACTNAQASGRDDLTQEGNGIGSGSGSCESRITADTLSSIYNMVTNARMSSNFEVADLVYLWKFYRERKDYTVASILLDNQYLYTPPAANYGGAWVLAPINDDYSTFHNDLENAIQGVDEPLIEQ